MRFRTDIPRLLRGCFLLSFSLAFASCNGGKDGCPATWGLPTDPMGAYPDEGNPWVAVFQPQPLNRPGDMMDALGDGVVELDRALFSEPTFAVLSPLTGLHLVTLDATGQISSRVEVPLPGEGFRLIVRGEYAYVVSVDPHGAHTDVSSVLLTDPGQEGSSVRLSGNASEVAVVGDVLYVSTDKLSCGDACAPKNEAQLTSLAIFGLELTPVDEVVWDLTEATNVVSFLFTPEYAFYTTSEYRLHQPGNVGLIDLSAGDGTMVRGEEQELSGSVAGRSRMSFFDGALRVVSEREYLYLDTFEIALGDLSALRRWEVPTEEEIYPGEVLLWGDRAFIGNYLGSDPHEVSVVDLTDPANPSLLAKLNVPGAVVRFAVFEAHLYAVSYDPEEPLILALSRWALGDLTAPAPLDTVRFRGPSYEFSEGDEVHLLVGRGLGNAADELTALVTTGLQTFMWDSCSPEWTPALHQFSIDDTGITLADTVEPLGPGARPVIFDQGVLSVSESSLHSLRTDSDDLQVLDDERIAERRLLAEQGSGSRWVGLSHDEHLHETFLVASEDDTGETVEIDLDSLFGYAAVCESVSTPWLPQVSLVKDWAIVPRYPGDGSRAVILHFVDVSDLSALEALGTLRVDFDLAETGPVEITQTDSTLLVGTVGLCLQGEEPEPAFYRVIDLRGSTIPTSSTPVSVPSLAKAGLYSPTLSPCSQELTYDEGDQWGNDLNVAENLVSGDVVALGYRRSVTSCDAKSPYRLALLDVSDPSAPKIIEDLEAPFLVTQYDHESGLIAGVDYATSERSVSDSEECEGDLQTLHDDTCVDYERLFQIGVKKDDTIDLLATTELSGSRVRMSKGRIFWRSDTDVRGLAFDETGITSELTGGGNDVVRFNVLGSHLVTSTATTFSVTDTSEPAAPVTEEEPLTRGDPCDGFSKTSTHVHCRTGRSGKERLTLP